MLTTFRYAAALDCPHCPDDPTESGFGAEACASCHTAHAGYGSLLDPTVGDTIDNLCFSCHNASGPAAEVNTHMSDVDGGCIDCEHSFSTVCTDCHDPHAHEQPYDNPTDPGAEDNFIQNLVRLPSGTRVPIVLAGMNGDNSFADADGTADGICEVCHTQTLHHTNEGNDQAHYPGANCVQCHVHTDSDYGFGFRPSKACDSCHGFPPIDLGTLASQPWSTGSTTAGAHALHTGQQSYDCALCHYNSDGEGPTHMTGPVTIGFDFFDGTYTGGTYDGQTTATYDSSETGTTVTNTGGKTCSSFYCHSDARGGAPNTVPTWDGAGPLPCDSCHNGTTDNTLEMVSNGHDRLASGNWVRHYPCQYCHSATIDAAAAIIDYTRHVNGTKDISFTSEWAIVGYPSPGYESGTSTCTNLYCHSDGTTVNPEVRDYSWTQGSTSCSSCHGHPDGSCADCHAGGVTGWNPGEEWKAAMPMYPNEGPGMPRANSHMRHLFSDYSCDECHSNTVENGTCDSCHTTGIPPGNMGEMNHIDPVFHVNKVKDVVFKGGGSYNPVTKTCSNTTCHTGVDPQWGGSVGDEVLCLGCHGTTEGDLDDFGELNGTRALIDQNEWAAAGHGRQSASGNYTSGNPPGNFPGNPCWYCHDNTVVHNDETNPFRLKKHSQFEQRYEKECVYCHMQGNNNDECYGCHDDAESLAPQLSNIPGPPQDHTEYAGGGTSCVASCHATDEDQHDTGAGTWTPEQQSDIKNQYQMMGVCLQCHENDSDGQCQSCHTGPQYALGYDPGTGHIAGVSKATSTHFGYKHWNQFETNGVWRGGKFCWDCHDPHGDTNIYMMQDKVATQTEGTFGIPETRSDVSFTRKESGMDYMRTEPPYTGLCNVCHTEAGQHYRFDYGDGHMAGRVCTSCHEHRYGDSHASGQACNSCHLDKPVPRHTAFGLPRDCTKCHEGAIGNRIDILGQFRANSHHVQGVEVTNRHCYACHWEATDIGLINVDYHMGYNFKSHVTTTGAAADLVIWEAGARPTTHSPGVTGTTFDATQIGTGGERAQVANVTVVCLACHSDQNNDTECFGLVDPANNDCKTPRQYAWDRTSIGARYSQVGTTLWGKHADALNSAQKDMLKAFSAHGNAVANEGGWSPTTGDDELSPNTRAGAYNVQCFDCHSSHGSKTEGITSSYKTFNGTYNGANLKETQKGKGGYNVTYRASGNTSGVNPYEAGAGQCFDCHETANAGTMPWGYMSTFGATEPIMGYRDGSHFGAGARGVTSRFAFKADREIMGGHLEASSTLDTPAMGAINGLCAPCHDPHGITPTLGYNQEYAVPLLKGTWVTSPYKEDLPRPGNPTGKLGNSGNYGNFQAAVGQGPMLDQNTFGTLRPAKTSLAGWYLEADEVMDEDASQFAGLCLRCHPKESLTDDDKRNQPWKSIDRVHETVKGWGTNEMHAFSCSKCHNAHSSGLPRLLRTNCLDYRHRGRVTSGGIYAGGSGRNGSGSFPLGSDNRNINCHPTGVWPNNYWNLKSPWVGP
ncbi:MAG: CxxxxCH/CxxCH domain-containing protein [Deltaproteobacteria bacterium]|nr:CxxxxCH/CxxCH domain-containing protein [Deltaproteobacteria bacterium]